MPLGAVIGVTGLCIFLIILCCVLCRRRRKKEKEKRRRKEEKEKEDRDAEMARKLGRMLLEWVASYQRQQAPQVEAAVDEGEKRRKKEKEKRSRKKEKEKEDKEAEMARMSPELVASYRRQPAPHVEAAVDEGEKRRRKKEKEKRSRKKEKEKEDKEAEMARMSPELVASYQRQPAPQVEAAVDEEAGLEKQTIDRFIEHMLQEKPARFSSQLLEIFTSNYSTKLGEGGYGAVYKGHFPDGQPLAVKVLNNSSMDKRIKEQFMAEVNTIGKTYHRNLVRLYGFCFESKTKALVYEYMENGSLDTLLFEKNHEIEWDKLYEIAIGAARGLEYLHHFSNRRIIHYDIKPANVLLDSNFCPKIADFGLAKLCNRESTNTTRSRVGGTPGYAAPEAWMPFPVSYKCDVYSFGVMLFEIVGRRKNFDVNFGDSQEWFSKHVWENFDKGELEVVWENYGIEVKDREKAKTMVTVALWCVQHLPEARPSMKNVVRILEGGAEAATPPNPFQHLVSSANEPSCMVSSSNSTTNYDEYDINDTTINVVCI